MFLKFYVCVYVKLQLCPWVGSYEPC